MTLSTPSPVLERLPAHLRYLVRVYLTLIVVSALFRSLLWLVVDRSWGLTGAQPVDLLHAFFIGWRFDTVVACYLLALPFLCLSFARFFGVRRMWPYRASRLFLAAVLLPVLFILAADIPWFLHNYARLSTSALLWMDDARFAAGMVLSESSFAIYLLPFVAGYALCLYGIRPLPKEVTGRLLFWQEIVLFCLTGGLLFLGIRGRLDEKSPIQTGTAYFSEDPFLNQLGLNPVFTFGSSVERKFSASRTRVALMDDQEALRNATGELGGQQGLRSSPIARNVVTVGPIDSLNVVIILMESMSTFKLGEYGGPRGLAPFLSALRPASLDVDHAYSAGIHTFNGIYSTLYSFPALYDQQPMEDWLDKKHKGLAHTLHDHGWSTLFCTTHDPEFDNMQGFLKSHGYDRVISEDDYPDAWIASTNGVPDHRMFEFVVPELNALAKKGPFLSVFMTTSDHKPYILPDSLWFKPKSEKLEDRIVEYADRSVERFFDLASKEPWYKKTVFVILGDHGINMGHTYDMPMSFHHTPLVFHAPGGQVPPGRITSPCGQIDVGPTVLGMLNIPWTNVTMGMDIRKQVRPFMFFCADDRIGCIDGEHYFIHRSDGHETLYAYADLSTTDHLNELPLKTDAMRTYAFSMMQSTQWLVDHDLLNGGPIDSVQGTPPHAAIQ
jgi:phosphoglycerol transferase MdoB-like AlkP superfamily enzyme